MRKGHVRVPSGFVGVWSGHGRFLEIRSSGAVHIDFRTYKPCGAVPTSDCDGKHGNDIRDGGQAYGRLVAVMNANTVTVDFTSSTDPVELPVGRARLGHDVSNDAVALFVGQWPDAPFCGDASPTGYCGA